MNCLVKRPMKPCAKQTEELEQPERDAKVTTHSLQAAWLIRPCLRLKHLPETSMLMPA